MLLANLGVGTRASGYGGCRARRELPTAIQFRSEGSALCDIVGSYSVRWFGRYALNRDMMRLMRIARLRLIALVWFSVMTLAPAVAQAEVIVNGRPAVVLESSAAKLVVDLGGGSIVDFHLAGDGLNTLRWIGPADENAVLRPMAHFLCLDRWGQPSEAELRNGMPFHGEAARIRWREVDAPERSDGRIVAAMGATLPMAGLEVRRTVRLSEAAAVFSVSETVTNRNKLGRVYNMVQHATIGP